MRGDEDERLSLLSRDGEDKVAEREPARGARFTIRLAFFSTASYLCAYGLRKPWIVLDFSAAPPILGASPKVAIAVRHAAGSRAVRGQIPTHGALRVAQCAQMVTYFCGKTFGVGLVSRVPQHKLRRALALAGGWAALGWVGFGLLPYGVLTLLSASLGGFPLALCWSLIYRYVEGRRCSDAVGGVMGVSIIVGPGVGKLVCASAVHASASLGLSEWLSPMLTAALFLPLLLLCLLGLDATPPPLPSERAELGDRAIRIGGVSGVGGQSSLWPLLKQHAPAIACVGAFNALMIGSRECAQPQPRLAQPTAPPPRARRAAPAKSPNARLCRTPARVSDGGVYAYICSDGRRTRARIAVAWCVHRLRDVFQPELWTALYGHTPSPTTFLITELPATALLLLLLPPLSFVRSASWALLMMHMLMLIAGLCLPLLSSLRESGALSGASWFALVGAAIFLGAVTVTAGFSDRLVAALQLSGSASGLIQLIDALGYAGGLCALVAMEVAAPEPGKLLPTAELLFAIFGPLAVLCALGSGMYWAHVMRRAARHEHG
jgi:hypothetical protein